jgi:hypothetical protein
MQAMSKLVRLPSSHVYVSSGLATVGLNPGAHSSLQLCVVWAESCPGEQHSGTVAESGRAWSASPAGHRFGSEKVRTFRLAKDVWGGGGGGVARIAFNQVKTVSGF